MRTVVGLLCALTLFSPCLANAGPTYAIGVGESRSGTIAVEHVYVLELPAGLSDVTIALDGGGDDVDLRVYFGFAEELLFEDFGIEPDPRFHLRQPRAGRYEIHVLNLIGRTVTYDLRVTSGPPTGAAPTAEEFFVAEGGAAVGPMTLAALRDRIARGITGPADLVWRAGLDAWVRADALPELAGAFAPPPPPAAPPLPTPPAVPPAPPAAPAPAPTPQPPADGAWRPVQGGEYCFRVPTGWVDDTANAAGPGDGEVLAAWMAATGDAGVFLTLLTQQELADGIDDIARDPDVRYVRQFGAALAGTDAVWREYEVAGEGRVNLIHQAQPRGDGRVLGVVSMIRLDADAALEAALHAVVASIVPCAGAPDARPPAAGEVSAGTLWFTIEGRRYSYPAVGRRDASGVTGVFGGGPEAVASLTFVADRPGTYGATQAGTSFVFQWLAGEPPFRGNVPGNPFTYLATPDLFPIELRLDAMDAVGGTIRGSFRGHALEGGFEVPHTDADAPAGTGIDMPAVPGTPVGAGRTPDVQIAYPTMRGSLDATRTDVRHTITLDRPGDLRAVVRASGDLTIHAWLLDVNGSSTLHSATTGYEPVRVVERGGLAPGTYQLRVQRTRGQGDYTIETTLDAITTPEDREPNDRSEQAQAIQPGVVTTGHLGYGNGERGTDTDDWYAIAIDRDGDLVIRVEADDRLAIHAWLVDTNGASSIHAQTTGYESVRVVERAGLAPGTYFLRVQRTRGYGGYAVSPTFTPQTIPADREPNDRVDLAQPIRLGEPTTGRLGYGSPTLGTDTDDWFAITTDRDGDLRVAVRATGELTIHAWLLDVNGTTTLHAQTTGYEPERVVERGGLAPGTYFLRVQRTRGHGGYTIHPVLTPVTGANDREPNDRADQAQAIGLGEVTPGRLGYGSPTLGTDTDDWYRVTTDQTGDLRFVVRASGELTIHAWLVDANGSTSLHAQTTGYEQVRVVERAGLAPGTYYLRIQRTRGHGGYTIEPSFTRATR